MSLRFWLVSLLPVAAISAAAGSADSFRNPKQIYEIMKKSKLKYQVVVDSSAFFDLRAVEKSPIAYADPDWIVVKDPSGEPDLKKQSPTSCAVREDSLAMAAFSARDFKAAASGYRRAYECDKSWVKALTYLGNSFFAMEKMDSAVYWLKKSIEANPDDYQAHFFLADAYLSQGRAEPAFSEFLEAYMRNPNSENIQEFAVKALQMTGKKMDKSWPVFGCAVDSLKDGAKIRLADTRHMALANCLAAWKFDPEFKDLRKADDPIQQTRLKNCLANQVVVAMAMKEDGAPIDRVSGKLVRIAELDLVGAMVVWERLSRSHPSSIYLLPPEVKAQLRAYLAEAVELR